MIRLCALLLLVLVTAPSTPPIERRSYYRNPEMGIELWVPRGLPRYKKPLKDTYACWINDHRNGLHCVIVREVDASSDAGTVEDFISYWKGGSSKQFKTVEFEVIRDVPAGGRRATLVWHKNLSGDARFDKDEEFIHAGIPLDSGNTLDLTFHFRVKTKVRALEEAYWILGTLRFSGEDGLDPWLGRRILHRTSGLSFRPPLGAVTTASAETIYLGRKKDAEVSIRGPVTGAALAASAPALKAVGKPWDSPHRSLRLRAGYHASAERGEVTVTAAVAGGQSFIIRCAGKPAARERLIRTAELVGMSLHYVNIEEARGRVATARDELATALDRKSKFGIAAAAKVLIELAFLEPATAALLDAIPRLDDDDLRARAAGALDVTRPEVAAAVMKLTRHPRVKKAAAVLAALVRALGPSPEKQVKSYLARLAGDRYADLRVVAAAIRALGNHEGDRKVTRDVVKLMKRAEAGATRADVKARERWRVLGPAFVEALERLTGERLTTAKQAAAWLKKNR